jgi:hypothetical protein
MQQVEACEHSHEFFWGHKGENCEPWSVLAIGIRPVS